MSSYRYPDVIVRLWGEKYPQRQDSVTDQLWDLVPIAIALGCYDAADHLRRSLSTPDKNLHPRGDYDTGRA